jgi:hypothetical protein
MSVFEKLTDPSQYTGTHKQRFDANGKGRGIDGRENRVELDGYVDGFKKQKEKKPNMSEKEASVIERLTDPSKYTFPISCVLFDH